MAKDEPTDPASDRRAYLRRDLRSRLYLECEAMLATVGNRALPLNDATQSQLGLLETGVENCKTIPLPDLMRLHAALASAVSPSLPGALELVEWEAKRPVGFFLRPIQYFAPIRAVRNVMVFAAFCAMLVIFSMMTGAVTADFVAKGVIFSQGEISPTRAISTPNNGPVNPDGADAGAQGATPPATENRQATANSGDAANGQNSVTPPPHWQQNLSIILFYLGLAGLGACFSVLYDAYSYFAEGKYDPRQGANYGMRIGLGLVAGFLLSQTMFQSWDADNSMAVFGRPALALIGGFASKVVYDILHKMSEAVSGLFEDDLRYQIDRAREQAKANAEMERERENAIRNTNVNAALMTLNSAETPTEKQAATEQIMAALNGSTAPIIPFSSTVTPVTLASTGALLDYLNSIVDLLPAAEGQPVRDTLDRLDKALAAARSLPPADGLKQAAAIMAEAKATELVTRALAKALTGLAGPLAALQLTPAGLAAVIIALTLRHAGPKFDMWRQMAIGPVYVPGLFTPPLLSSQSLKTLVDVTPDLTPLAGMSSGELAQLGRDLTALSNADMATKYAGKFADTASFDLALALLRNEMLIDGTDLVPADILAKSGASDSHDIGRVLARLQQDRQTRAELDRLFLIAAEARGNPAATQLVEQSLADTGKGA